MSSEKRGRYTKYQGVAHVVAKTTWLCNLLHELHFLLIKVTLVFCDNNNVVYPPTIWSNISGPKLLRLTSTLLATKSPWGISMCFMPSPHHNTRTLSRKVFIRHNSRSLDLVKSGHLLSIVLDVSMYMYHYICICINRTMYCMLESIIYV